MKALGAALMAMILAMAADAPRAQPPAHTAPKAPRPNLPVPPAAKPAASWTEPVTGMAFVAVPKGCFAMGSTTPRPPHGQAWEEVGFKGDLAADERPQHKVCLDAYWIARHEVRRGDWRRLMASTAGSQADDELPMGGVSWDEAMRFVAQLNQRSPGAERFRLPTEAEWEHACRAGSAGDLSPEATFRSALFAAPFRAPVSSAPAGSLAANAWGISDMLGNLWEWVADSYASDAYATHALFNPRHEGSGNRVIRGGSYRSELDKVRCAARGDYPPAEALPQIGFRLVMTRPPADGKAAQ